MIKFGKPSTDVLRHKTSFFDDNDRRLQDCRRLFKEYINQPHRSECINCAQPLAGKSFRKMGVDYFLCNVCGHLNGAHEDTDIFCNMIYIDDDGKAYALTYNTKTKENYKKRVQDIYVPKAHFLMESLRGVNADPSSMRFVDLGAGSGYFVSALKKTGLCNVLGYEVSKTQVELANAMIGSSLVIQHNLADTIDIASRVEADVICLIGVLEHVQYPRKILSTIAENENLRYLFLSIPLFSPCVFFEMVFEEVMPRHLAPAHTHLYTESSIDYFCEEFGFQKISEWWFGTDMIDLFRNIWVMLKKISPDSDAISLWKSMFKPMIDNLQITQDRQKMSSEVHLLLKLPVS